MDYCQYLSGSQVTFTLTNLAELLESFGHDTIDRYVEGEKVSPRLSWEQARSLVEIYPEAYLIFDDTVLDKRFGAKIEVVPKQCSGNKKGCDPWRDLAHLREPENGAFTLCY